MTKDNKWIAFFDNHASKYMDEVFVANTVAEVDFLIEHLNLSKESKILDMGCGTGRHAIELGKRGYSVTGIDISEGMLNEARKTAKAENVTTVTFQQADATKFTSDVQYDSVYCVCEGSLGLISAGDDPYEHDLAVLKNLYNALKPDGRMLITCLNGMRFIRQYQQSDVEAGTFDPLTLAETVQMPSEDGDITVQERGMVPSELRLLLRMIGFEVEHVGGGTAGNWGLRQVELDEIELMAICTKTAIS